VDTVVLGLKHCENISTILLAVLTQYLIIRDRWTDSVWCIWNIAV